MTWIGAGDHHRKPCDPDALTPMRHGTGSRTCASGSSRSGDGGKMARAETDGVEINLPVTESRATSRPLTVATWMTKIGARAGARIPDAHARRSLVAECEIL
jgi:hypothetical protein